VPHQQTRTQATHVRLSSPIAPLRAKMMESILLDDYEDTDTDWLVIAHVQSDSRAPEDFADPKDFAQTAGFDAGLTDSDEDYASQTLGDSRPGPKPGGYDSRIEQILYENPQLPILITDAGKGSDGTKYISYTIRTGVRFRLAILVVG
jgi:hypothetical protein